MAQKWSAQLERKSSFIKQEEITTILQEATADIEYWMSQKEKIKCKPNGHVTNLLKFFMSKVYDWFEAAP